MESRTYLVVRIYNNPTPREGATAPRLSVCLAGLTVLHLRPAGGMAGGSLKLVRSLVGEPLRRHAMGQLNVRESGEDWLWCLRRARAAPNRED